MPEVRGRSAACDRAGRRSSGDAEALLGGGDRSRS
jgi:hypothetical protein